MLTFLNSAILIGLVAVALPILIHLFTRQKIKIVQFSSLRFLKELQKQQIRRLKLRQILLLILRALLILALVLAFARPALKQTASSSLQSGAQLTAVILLDNSLSMGRKSEGQRLLEQAKKRALEVVQFMRPGDEMYLLYPQSPPVFAHDGPRYSVETMRELIKGTELSYSGTDYIAALSLADEIMQKSSNINKEVYLVGDLQRQALITARNGNGTRFLDDGVKLFVLPVTADDAENFSISEVRIANQILEKDKVMEIEAVVNSHSQRSVSNKLVHLFVNGKRVAQQTVNLEPNAAQKIVFRMVPDRTGLQSGYVMLEDDDLLEDNRRYFTYEIPGEVSVLLVGTRHEDTYLLSLALNPERQKPGRIKYKEILSSALGDENLHDYQVVVLSNVARLDNPEVLRIRSFLERGGGVLIFLGGDVNLRNYNEYLHAKLNLPLLTGSISGEGQDGFLSMNKIDYSHPLFKDVFDEDKNVISPHFRVAVNVKSDKPIDKIVEFSNGAPFLFEARYRQGRILYCTTGISNDWSDLPLRGIFVPLVDRSVAYLAGTASERRSEILVGEVIAYSPDQLVTVPELSMEGPDGTRHQIKPEISGGRYSIRFNRTDQIGVYQLRNENEAIASWAVNYNPLEADQTTFDIDELENVVAAEGIYPIRALQDVAAVLQGARFGRELWKYFAALALCLLIAEMILYREKGEPEK